MENLAAATNGYFQTGYGTRQRAVAGVGAALPQDAMTSSVNPAGMATLSGRSDMNLEWFHPVRGVFRRVSGNIGERAQRE